MQGPVLPPVLRDAHCGGLPYRLQCNAPRTRCERQPKSICHPLVPPNCSTKPVSLIQQAANITCLRPDAEALNTDRCLEYGVRLGADLPTAKQMFRTPPVIPPAPETRYTVV